MSAINVITQARSTSVPSIASDATALAANQERLGFSIQNCGTNPLFVRFGAGASTTVFNVVLAAGTGNDNGTGGAIHFTDGTIPTSIITIAGTSPRYVASEYIE